MVVIKQNVIYDQTHELATDIYFPNDTNSNTKILIFWHGGGWFRGNKDSVKNIGIRFANAGFMTFIPEYRLAPANTFPTAHADAINFIKWLLKSKYTDPDDLNNIAQIGASVGGTMALQIAGKYSFPTVTWSAPVDFSNWIKIHQEVKPALDPQKELNLKQKSQINQAFYKYFTLTYAGANNSDILSKMDATSYDYTNLGPLMMINSANELIEIDTVLNFVKFLAKNNHEIELLIIKGNRHAMSYSKEYIDETLDFLYQINKRNNITND